MDKGSRQFMYEYAWTREETYDATVVQGWTHGIGGGGLAGLNDALLKMQVDLSD